MSQLLSGKVALVTGAGKGIGHATALLLAAHGATVVGTARSEADLQKLLDEIIASGGQGLVLSGDLTSEEFVGQLFQLVEDRCGRLDILINNAGIGAFAPVAEMPVATLRHCLEVNVVAAFHCMQRAIGLMRARGDGKIINVGSVRSHWSEGGDSGAYNASKFALRAITESVARELHGSGARISVGMVCPGIVDTTLTNPGGDSQPDWLQPETVAAAILHAVSAPDGVNVFDTVLFPTAQRPW